MDGRVVLTGLRPDVMRVLDAADVLLQPSRHEAFPTSLIEAMAARVPVIASDTGGIPEIVESGENGTPDPRAARRRAVSPARSPTCSPTTAADARSAAAGRAAIRARLTAGPWVQPHPRACMTR